MEDFSALDGSLFEAVQRGRVFEDSKTFVDCVPTDDLEAIRRRFESARDDPDFDLRSFVRTHFCVPEHREASVPQAESLAEHVRRLWPMLVEDPADAGLEAERGSLIELPEPYVTPGGRFRELYYWDSYFTAEGLAVCDRDDLIANFADNFAWCIDEYGFVPNGNREYFTTRSQPPLFAEVLDVLARERGVEAVAEYLPALEREYEFWMDEGGVNGSADESAAPSATDGGDRPRASGDSEGATAARRVVSLPDGRLNRFWDDAATPRRESYREDVRLADRADGRDDERLYRHVRASCESGWDFSSRWFRGESLETVRTTDLVPVDLNAALYGLESKLAEWHREVGDDARADRYSEAARVRRELLDSYCWDPDAGFFFDYCFTEGERTDSWTLAGAVPLFFGACTDEQAAAVADHLREKFLRDGGLTTTLTESGEQWDAPNGWAPLQWFSVVGLRRYGHDDLAREIAVRWIRHVGNVYDRTGKLFEKYNVRDTSLHAGGGEYPLQDGFGWTNGVTVALQERFDYPTESAVPRDPA